MKQDEQMFIECIIQKLIQIRLMTDTKQFYRVEDSVLVDEVRARVIASGCAILFAYTLNYAFQVIVTLFYKSEDPEKAKLVTKKLLQTTRVMYWFGVASIFSIYPPYYYGIHCAILGWFTFCFLIFFHISIFFDLDAARKRSIWSICYLIYHILVFIWLLVTLIMAYVWSARAEERTRTS